MTTENIGGLMMLISLVILASTIFTFRSLPRLLLALIIVGGITLFAVGLSLLPGAAGQIYGSGRI